MRESKEIKKTRKLLKVLGIRAVPHEHPEAVSYAYRNKTKTIFISHPWYVAPNTYINEILHDIGHYLVAPPGRRKLKDFGIDRLTEDNAEREERQVRMIEKELSQYVGVKPPYNVKHDQWFKTEGHIIVQTVIDLAKSI